MNRPADDDVGRCPRGVPGVLAIATLALTAAFTGPLGHAGEAQLYKSVDDQGHVVYTDRAPTLAVPKTTVRVHEPSAEELAQAAKLQAAAQAADSQRIQQTLITSVSKAQQQREKQARCEAARNQFFSLKDASRIYRHDADGNRVFLSDAEADARRGAARQAMETACAP